MSTDEWTKWMEKLHTVSKYNTSKYKRKLTSAGDERMSSKSIGIVAICVLISVALVILVMDAPKVIGHLSFIQTFLKARLYQPQKDANKKGK